MIRPGGSGLVVTPGQPLRGEYRPAGDKSISHRAALLASLAQGESRIDHFLVAGVTQAMLSCLADLGVDWRLESDHLLVSGKGFSGLGPAGHALDCGNSATTLRLLAGALSAAAVPATLDGSDGLRKRPMQRIIEPLRQMGVEIASHDGCAPLELISFMRPLHALEHNLPVASAQVKSCLLLAALAGDGTTVINEPGPSRDHTERLLAHMGVEVAHSQANQQGAIYYRTSLDPPNPLQLKPLSVSIPGDFSSAAFLIVAALITPGSEILLRQVGLNPTRVGLLEALWEMGADITITQPNEQMGEPVGDLAVRASPLHGTQVSGTQVVRMIDEFPALAVAASFAQGTTIVSQAEELRLKESDRIGQLCLGLASLGVIVKEQADGFTLQGDILPSGGSVEAHGDHRLAMALALVGLASHAAVRVQGAEVINESFPDFVTTMHALGADMEVAA